MSKDRLKELKEELKLAKEANKLTVENIGKIVSNATTSILKELKFDKDMTADALKDVLDTTTNSLKEFGELTAQNAKASSDGAQKSLKKELSKKSKKLEKVYHTLADDVKEDIVKKIDTFKAFSELSLDVLQHVTDGAIKGVHEVLDEKTKKKNKKSKKKS
jgi:hypothetical protein